MRGVKVRGGMDRAPFWAQVRARGLHGTDKAMRMTIDKQNARGFTLIELMITVAILGVLAAVAITAYTKNIRRARRTEITSNLAKMSLLQDTAMRVRSHYISTQSGGIASFNDWYPRPSAFVPSVGTRVETVQWQVTDTLYHRDGAADGPNFRGGGQEHGFDALGFMPEGGTSRCSYAAISGQGLFTDPATGNQVNEVPHNSMLGVVFNDDDRYKFRPWFVNMAACDLDADGNFWFFYTNSYDSRVYEGLDIPAAGARAEAF